MFWLGIGKWVSVLCPDHLSVSKFWFLFQFPFHPPGVRGHKPEINLEPDTLSSWAPMPASHWSNADNAGLWLAERVSSGSPGPQSYVNGVSTIFWDSTFSNGVQNYLTNVNGQKILDFPIFHGTEESSLAQLRKTQQFKIIVGSLYEWIKSRFRQCTMNLKTAQYSQMAYINVLLCGCSEY